MAVARGIPGSYHEGRVDSRGMGCCNWLNTQKLVLKRLAFLAQKCANQASLRTYSKVCPVFASAENTPKALSNAVMWRIMTSGQYDTTLMTTGRDYTLDGITESVRCNMAHK